MRLKSGSPVSAISRSALQYINDVLKYLTVRNGRLHVSGNRWVIECSGSGAVEFPFKASLETVVEDDVEVLKVKIAKGMRRVIDQSFEVVATESFAVGEDGGVVYMTWTYTTTDPITGEVDTEGEWGDLEYGDLDSFVDGAIQDDLTKKSFRIASVEKVDDTFVLTQEHFGNIEVLDIVRALHIES